jgi:hypothetical protein
MHVTRVYTGEDGESHFEDIDFPLKNSGKIGRLSDIIPATGVILRETGEDYDYDWHNAPHRQFVLLLQGGVEIEVGDGETRRFHPGEILLVEDTTGRGHRSRSIQHQARISVFVTLD